MAEILWESPAKNENGVPYFTVKMESGYYVYGERLGRDSVAFILYDQAVHKVGLINEIKPPIGPDVFMTTAFGGSLDKDIPVWQIVVEEVKEEAGYTVTESDVNYVGKVLVSTQMNQFCHLYLVDITGKTVGERELEEHEAGSTVVWVDMEDISEVEDWKTPTIILKAIGKNIL